MGPTIAPATANPNTVPSVWPRRARSASTVTHASAPGPGHRAREPLDEARDAEGEGGAGQREPDAREREHGETGDDGAARADPGREDAAGNAAEQRAGAEGGEEDPRLELAQAEVLGVAGEEGHERAEEHRVDEHDDADEGEQAAHGASLVGPPMPCGPHGNAPSGWPLRPASRLTSAEAGADRGTINLRNSLLGARRNLGAAGAAVKFSCRKNSRNLRTNRIPLRNLISPAPSSRLRPGKSRRRIPSRKRKCTAAVAPSSSSPTDLRRNDCHSEGLQPQALLPRCNHHTRGSDQGPSSTIGSHFLQIAFFPSGAASNCGSRSVL